MEECMDKDLFEKGLAARKETLGEEYVEKSLAAADDFTRPFQEALTAWCWGFGWSDKAIDASVVLADGTKIRDVVDLKQWMVANIDQFSQCVAEKLMTYATGRALNYAERNELAEIVRANGESASGFRDLVLALIQSRTFRTR